MVKRTLFFIMTFLIFSRHVYALSAQSAILIDKTTGRILYEKNAYQKTGMASTTKIMTAIIALENEDLEKIVEVSYEASSTIGSSMYLNTGEKIKTESLIYGLMLSSGNDAATAIAQSISGNINEFAKLMNEKAQKIGMKNTHFDNPHGLDSDTHYSTAYDMALLTRYAMNNEKFCEIVSSKRKNVELNGIENSRFLTNHNKLLSLYPYCNGVKTGFTKACGRCLVSSAEKDGISLIAVTLNAPDDWNDHINMYEDAFSKLKLYKITEKNSYICSVDVKNSDAKKIELYSGDKIYIPLTEEEYKNINIKYDYPKSVNAPLYKGQICGKLTVLNGNEKLCETDLLTAYGITEKTEVKYFDNIFFIFTDLLSLFFKSI